MSVKLETGRNSGVAIPLLARAPIQGTKPAAVYCGLFCNYLLSGKHSKVEGPLAHMVFFCIGGGESELWPLPSIVKIHRRLRHPYLNGPLWQKLLTVTGVRVRISN